MEKTYLKCKNWDSISCPYGYHEFMVKTYHRPYFRVFKPTDKEKKQLDKICQNCPAIDFDSSAYAC